MIRIKFVLRELIRNLGRNPGTAIASLLSLTLLFLMLDLFWIGSLTTDRIYRNLVSELTMELFIPEEMPDSIAVPLEKSFLSLPAIRSTRFVSREDARDELESLVGIDLLVGYDSANPLPRSFIMRIEPEYLTTSKMDSLGSALESMTNGGEARYSRHWLAKAEATRLLFLQVGIALGLLVLLATLISSANSIRLMARARGQSFHQMILLGAPRLFIAFPFLLEGFLLAGLSAAAGWAVIHYGMSHLSFVEFTPVIPPRDEILLFCFAMAFIGLISGFVGIRRLLR